MKLVIIILAVAIPASVLLISSIFIIFRCCRNRVHQQTPTTESPPKPGEDTFQATISKLQLSHKSISKPSLRFHQLHHQQSLNHDQTHNQLLPPFSWQDNPRLISEAVESGWTRFAFANRPTVPRSSPLWGSLCGKPQEEGMVNWETPPETGSTEYMQTVRINPAAMKKSGSVNNPLRVVDDSTSCSFIRMSLPLPGPPLIGTSFPQEAYFEISILYLQPLNRASKASKRAKDGPGDDGHDDQTKLIEEGSNGVQFDAVDDGGGGGGGGERKRISSPFTKVMSVSREGKHRSSQLSFGLSRGGSVLSKSAPGMYPGSIGFHSDGCVYLDGTKLVSESDRTEWAGVNRVIGCGFNPSKKKVYFTVESELVHVIRCNSEVYKSPLYPVLSSNSDVMVLVNLGQAAFKYAPANVHRTPNPCFLRAMPGFRDSSSSVIGYDDSRELFSMGRIDSEWLGDGRKSKMVSSRNSRASSGNWEDASVTIDIDGESDLFEISLHN